MTPLRVYYPGLGALLVGNAGKREVLRVALDAQDRDGFLCGAWIAARLGFSRQWVNRVLSMFEALGWIGRDAFGRRVFRRDVIAAASGVGKAAADGARAARRALSRARVSVWAGCEVVAVTVRGRRFVKALGPVPVSGNTGSPHSGTDVSQGPEQVVRPPPGLPREGVEAFYMAAMGLSP
jgi:hypothetical protein